MFDKYSQKAFSLIELMVVISIIAIISAISITSLQAIQKNGRDAQRQSDIRVIQGALQQFYADHNYYPDSLALNGGASFVSVVTPQKTYLSKTPVDPTSGTATPYCYVSQISSSITTDCTANPGKCHFYRLNAKLENPGSGVVNSSCGGQTTYNFEVKPL